MGFEVDFLGERVGRMMLGFMGKRKKQKVIHGPHATPSHHAPPPLPLRRHARIAYWAMPDAEDQQVNGLHPGARASTERPAVTTMLGQMDSCAAEFEAVKYLFLAATDANS